MNQVLIAEESLEDFNKEVNSLLLKGYKVIPGTIYAVALNDDEDLLFAITLWKDGYEVMITAQDLTEFRNHVRNHLNNGYMVVVGTLYATSMEEVLMTVRRKTEMFTQYFFNVLGKE